MEKWTSGTPCLLSAVLPRAGRRLARLAVLEVAPQVEIRNCSIVFSCQTGTGRGQSGVNLGSTLGQSGIILGSIRDHPGVKLQRRTLRRVRLASVFFTVLTSSAAISAYRALGSDGYCSPHYRIPFYSRNEGLMDSARHVIGYRLTQETTD